VHKGTVHEDVTKQDDKDIGRVGILDISSTSFFTNKRSDKTGPEI
jgi:hypothetical protein